MKTSIFQNSNKNIVRTSALNFFVASWGLPGDVVSNIINKKAYRKLQGRYKNFQGEILEIFSLLFWKISVLINSF